MVTTDSSNTDVQIQSSAEREPGNLNMRLQGVTEGGEMCHGDGQVHWVVSYKTKWYLTIFTTNCDFLDLQNYLF